MLSTTKSHPHGLNWSRWLHPFKDQPDVHGLEVGTFRGESAQWMLENIFTGNGATYSCIDSFDPEGSVDHQVFKVDCSQNERIARERLEPYGDRVRIYKLDSARALRHLWIGHYSFVYIDGDHRAQGTLRDGVMGFELLRPQGVMVFDDYRWKEMPAELDRPQMAIDCFIKNYARQIRVLEPRGWQIAVMKL